MVLSTKIILIFMFKVYSLWLSPVLELFCICSQAPVGRKKKKSQKKYFPDFSLNCAEKNFLTMPSLKIADTKS